MPALKQIDFETARRIAAEKGLSPSKVRGTDTLRFSRTPNDKLRVITWKEFRDTAESRELAVYESGGWMKLMRKPTAPPPFSEAADDPPSPEHERGPISED